MGWVIPKRLLSLELLAVAMHLTMRRREDVATTELWPAVITTLMVDVWTWQNQAKMGIIFFRRISGKPAEKLLMGFWCKMQMLELGNVGRLVKRKSL